MIIGETPGSFGEPFNATGLVHSCFPEEVVARFKITQSNASFTEPYLLLKSKRRSHLIKQFPGKPENTAAWMRTILAGLTLFYVLYVFKGYNIQQGVSYSGHTLLTRCVLFGLANALVFYLFEFHLLRAYPVTTAPGKLAWRLAELLAGGSITFLLFNYFWSWSEWFWPAYTRLMAEYLLVMVIPTFIVSGYTFLRTKKSRTQASSLKFVSENGKDILHISPKDFLFVKAAGNYVEVHFLSGEVPQMRLIRNSLKKIEDTYRGHQHFVRCHRSYIVNPAKIDKIYKRKGKAALLIARITIPLAAAYETHFLP